MELFGPTLLRNFPLKNSDFLGIFKNVLTGVYCNKNKNRTKNHSIHLLILLYISTPHPLQFHSRLYNTNLHIFLSLSYFFLLVVGSWMSYAYRYFFPS
jgi:hypothetical protein